MNEIKKQLQVVASIRNELNTVDTEYKKLLSEFEKTHEDKISRITDIKDILNSAEDELRVIATKEYSQNTEKNKKLYGGVEIRVVKTMTYSNDTAFTWAEKHGIALKLDDKIFKKIARVLDLNFVWDEIDITATIPKNIKIEGDDDGSD